MRAATACLLLSLACRGPVEPLRPPPRDAGDPLPTVGGRCEPWPASQYNTSLMMPGRACLGCHGEDPSDRGLLTVAGTVFADVRQEDDCPGVDGAEVELTDAAGRRVRLPTNLAGNFYLRTPVVFPLRARVIAGGRVRAMEDDVEHGDCNACHTASGEGDAPGRIVRP